MYLHSKFPNIYNTIIYSIYTQYNQFSLIIVHILTFYDLHSRESHFSMSKMMVAKYEFEFRGLSNYCDT